MPKSSKPKPPRRNPQVPPSETQIGGDHYKKLAIQPGEFTTRNHIPHLLGDAISYLCRFEDKEGQVSLEKAIHSIQLYIEFRYGQ